MSLCGEPTCIRTGVLRALGGQSRFLMLLLWRPPFLGRCFWSGQPSNGLTDRSRPDIWSFNIPRSFNSRQHTMFRFSFATRWYSVRPALCTTGSWLPVSSDKEKHACAHFLFCICVCLIIFWQSNKTFLFMWADVTLNAAAAKGGVVWCCLHSVSGL